MKLRRIIIALILLLIVGLSGIVSWFAFSPSKALEALRRFLPAGTTIKTAQWNEPFHLELQEITITNLATIKKLRVRTDFKSLKKRQIKEVVLDGPHLYFSMNEALSDKKNREKQTDSAVLLTNRAFISLKNWFIQDIRITNGVITLADLGPGIPPLDIPFQPVLKNVVIGSSSDNQLLTNLISVTLPNLTLYSPYDPLTKLLEIEAVQLVFSLKGLAEQKIHELSILAPQIYVGPHLFWFSEQVMKRFAERPTSDSVSPIWNIDLFDLRGGALNLSPQGQSVLRLPLVFSAHQSNLVLTSFDKLHLQSSIIVPRVSLEYPEYQLAIEDLEGTLEFALPRTSKDANNLVNVLRATKARWKKIQSTNLWLSATFDASGAYVDYGAEAYGGYINGGVSVFFTNMSWVGWVAASDLNLEPLSRALSPEQVRITGKASAELKAQGLSKLCEKLSANFRLLQPGKLEILSLDPILKKIPENATGLKADALRIAVEAFRNYHYSNGMVQFEYHPPKSDFLMKMNGLEGQRNFKLTYHHQPTNN